MLPHNQIRNDYYSQSQATLNSDQNKEMVIIKQKIVNNINETSFKKNKEMS